MPQDELDSFLADMAAEADRLGLEYSGNPNNLSKPVDAIDAMLELFNIEPGDASREKRLKEFPPIEVPHEYTDIDDQPEDPEEWEQAIDTLKDFLEYEYSGEGNIEKEFRDYLLAEDYSYSAKTIVKLLELALKSHR